MESLIDAPVKSSPPKGKPESQPQSTLLDQEAIAQARKKIRETARVNIATASRALKIQFGDVRELTVEERAKLLVGKSPQKILLQAGISDDRIDNLLTEAHAFLDERNKEKEKFGKHYKVSSQKAHSEKEDEPDTKIQALIKKSQAAFREADTEELPPVSETPSRAVTAQTEVIQPKEEAPPSRPKSYTGEHIKRKVKPFFRRGRHRQ